MSLWGLLRDPQEAMPSFEENLTARLAQAPSADTDPPETDLEYYARPENYTGSNIHSIQRFVQKQRKHVPEPSGPVRADDSEIYNIVPAVTKPVDIIEDEENTDEAKSPDSVRKQRPRSASLRSTSTPDIKTKVSDMRRKSLSAPRPKTTDGLAIKQAFNVNSPELSYSAPAGRRMSRMLDGSLLRPPDSGQTTGRSRSSRISRVSQMFESPKIADALKAQLVWQRRKQREMEDFLIQSGLIHRKWSSVADDDSDDPEYVGSSPLKLLRAAAAVAQRKPDIADDAKSRDRKEARFPPISVPHGINLIPSASTGQKRLSIAETPEKESRSSETSASLQFPLLQQGMSFTRSVTSQPASPKTEKKPRQNLKKVSSLKLKDGKPDIVLPHLDAKAFLVRTGSRDHAEIEWLSSPAVRSRKLRARERFRKAIRLVQHALKWLSNIAKKSEGDEQMMSTFTDMVTSNAKDEELTFDPSYFKAKKEINISQEVQYILSIPPVDRTQDQLQTALYGLQHLRSFAEYPLHMQEKLCRVAWFEKVPPKRVIIRQGHIAENFYFILSGSAVVKILEKNPKTGETHQRMATIMRKGMSFGELALLHHSKRTATVVSQDTVQLLTIGRDDFFDIFMSGQGPGEIPEHIKFISTLDFMQEWPIEKLVEHPEQCLFHFFKRGVVIVKDSTKSDWLYIVKSGSCQVMKQLKGVTAKLGLRNKVCEGATDIRLPQLGTGESDCKVDTGRKRRHPKTPRSNRRCLTALQEFETERCSEPEGFRAKSEIGNASDHNPGFSHSRYRRLPSTNKPHFVHSNMMEPKKAWASRTPQATKPHPSKQEKALDPVFVQIELLKPRDVFGLTTLTFNNEIATSQTSVNLVSRGAECIMLSKKFFIQHATDNIRRMVRHQVQPYPNEATLQENLQIKADWELYKRSLTQRITHRS